MTNWAASDYLCPECDDQLEARHDGPGGMVAYRCLPCDWEKCYDPGADEFAVRELERGAA